MAKMSQRKFVDDANKTYGTNISHKIVAKMVREGRIGVSPSKPGPAGDFPKVVWESMKLAFVTYLQLEQATSKVQSTVKQMSLRVNQMVRGAGHIKTGNDLTRKLKSETACYFDVDKKNMQEHRRLQWTTHSNLNAWFDTWRNTLIHLGFAREKTIGDEDVVGELVFFDGQKDRILNLDETDGLLDNTNGQRGGRKPMVFYCHGVSGGGTEASKSSYSPTIICGSTAAGEALPPHFQLKTDATEDHRVKISIDFIAQCHNINGKFGHNEKKMHPCTFGLNEKAGMNAIELEKYFQANVLPLHPDVEDKPGKRVIAKVDSGPGRLFLPMLASLRLQGMYLVPGVPNTTGLTQETDQNYSPLKTYYRGNLEALSAGRFSKNMTLRVDDLPLLVFGGKDPETGVELVNSFANAFNEDNCMSAWAKCGAVPLTRQPLSSGNLKHEVIMNADGTIAEDWDPESHKLLQMEQCNKVQCAFLASLGYHLSQLRIDAPRRSIKKFQFTEPQSKERVAAIQKAKTSGQMFYATQGHHINSEEFFKARAKTERENELSRLKKRKDELSKQVAIERTGRKVIEEKGEPTVERLKDYTRRELECLFKWRVKKPLGSTNKEKMFSAILVAPPVESLVDWTKDEEDRLQDLLHGDINFKDTALAVALKQKAKALKHNVGELDKAEATELLHALQKQLNDTTTGGSTEGVI